jgi:hypothetical protein
MTTIYTQRPARRNSHQQHCDDGLHVPAITEMMAEPPESLTAGGRIIYRRTKRPAPTCNLLASLAGIGPMEAR